MLIVLGCLLAPLPVRDLDRENVIADAVMSLRHQRRVLLDGQYVPFDDSALLADRSAWYYRNETSLDSAKLEALGLHPLPEAVSNRIPGSWYEAGNVLVEVTYQSPDEPPDAPQLRFNCCHGLLGAQGYKVRIYRCLLGAFAYYALEWVS